MDERLIKIHTLIGIIKDAEEALEATMNGDEGETQAKKPRAAQKCGKCGSTEHNARNCDAVLPANQM